MKIIYADNAATTRVMPEVFESMKPFFEEHFGNPSSLYSIGRFSKNVLEKSRKSIADCINAKQNEIFFTSGGTESDNWALKSCVRLNPGDHVITSKIEHHAVLKSAKYLEMHGIILTYLEVDKFWLANPKSLEK